MSIKTMLGTGPFLGLMATVSSISIGQLLFKTAAVRANSAHSLFAPNVLLALGCALLMYAGATLIWIWVLRSVPLTLAYACISLSFVIVPILARIFLNEPLTARVAAGLMLIICGILISISGRPA